jgi:hypothetical protein
MPPRRRWRVPALVIALAILALAAANCRSGGDRAIAVDLFTRADLGAIVLRRADAPVATAYVAAVSGFKTLTSFARDDEELVHLTEDGFRVGHVVLFLPADHVSATGPAPPLTNDSVIVQGITGLFHDPDGADRSMERYVEDLKTRQIPDAKEIAADGLGDRSIGLRGMTPDGSRVLIFVWRVDNMILIVSGSGPLPAAEVRALADLVNARAS